MSQVSCKVSDWYNRLTDDSEEYIRMLTFESEHDIHEIKCAIESFEKGDAYCVNLVECDDPAFVWAEIST